MHGIQSNYAEKSLIKLNGRFARFDTDTKHTPGWVKQVGHLGDVPLPHDR